MFVVDTNVLVYAADAGAAEHERCRTLVEQWRRQSGAWYLTWGICYEFLRIVTHQKVFRRPWSIDGAVRFLTILQASPGLGLLGIPVQGVAQVVVLDGELIQPVIAN